MPTGTCGKRGFVKPTKSPRLAATSVANALTAATPATPAIFTGGGAPKLASSTRKTSVSVSREMGAFPGEKSYLTEVPVGALMAVATRRVPRSQNSDYCRI